MHEVETKRQAEDLADEMTRVPAPGDA
jgi:hypothetical protein